MNRRANNRVSDDAFRLALGKHREQLRIDENKHRASLKHGQSLLDIYDEHGVDPREYKDRFIQVYDADLNLIGYEVIL